MRHSRHSVSLGTFGLAFAIVLSPAFMQSGLTFSSCKTGDTRLSELVVEVSGQDQIASFDPELRIYDVWLSSSVDSAVVRAIPMDLGSQVWVNYYSDAGGVGLMQAEVSGGEVTVDLDPGESSLWIYVKAPGGASDDYTVTVHTGCVDCDDGDECTADSCNSGPQVCVHTPGPDGTACDFGAFPGICVGGACASLCSVAGGCDDGNDCTAETCTLATGECTYAPLDGMTCGNGAGTCDGDTCVGAFTCNEQGIRDAIATGGGPHAFYCFGPTTVVTAAKIVIDNDVILDGGGNLTLDGNYDHRVFIVSSGVTAELRGFAVTNGFRGCRPCTGGGCGDPCSSCVVGGGIGNSGTLIVTDSAVSGNGGPGIGILGVCDSDSVVTVTNSTVSDNLGGGIGGGFSWGGEIALTMTNSTVSGNGGPGIGVGTVTMTNSTVSGNGGDGIAGGTMTVTNSTVSDNSGDGITGRPTTVTNSTVSGNGGSGVLHTLGGPITVTNSTFSGNVAVAIFAPVSATLTNTIIDGDCLIVSAGASNGYNIESPGNTCGFDPDGTDMVNVSADDLKLGELADNGGPTMTHALLPGSVAIDVIPQAECVDADSEPLTTDQRGFPRDSMCDVGAFEVQP
jgi:hypothetical protein